MRWLLVPVAGVGCTLAAIGALWSAQALARQDQRPQFRGGVRTVAVYTTVRDADGRLAPDLTKSDFQILDQGKPVEIDTFSNDTLPFTAVLLLDMTGNIGKSFYRVRAAAQRFVQTLLPEDRIRIGTFGDEVWVSPLLTGDKTVLARVLDEELWPGHSGVTPLWRASTVAMDSLAQEPGRRVVLFLYLGHDSAGDFNCAPLVTDARGAIGPCATRSSVRRQAQDAGFMFYAINLEGWGWDPDLITLTDDSGGGHFRLARDANLDAAFERVADELHHQYALGFTPVVLDGKTHAISVRVTRPGMTVRARKSYLASGDR